MTDSLNEILKKDPKDVTVQERDSLNMSDLGKLTDRFNSQYYTLIEEANKPYVDKMNVVLVFCDGKVVKTYENCDNPPEEEILKIEQEKEKTCYILNIINAPSEGHHRIFLGH